ncbi:hypothetical protein [Paenibacillus periandrae]|uniref:hypothetical protein n=1 Tax=Paenibacillus periandrae TaxID=1761741 RepID=UPI001F08C31C|nr:hypothetical protein [Paenibacillus periandrae]
MDYTKFANTGLNVSQIYPGCIGFGDPEKGCHRWDYNTPIKETMKAKIVGLDLYSLYIYSCGIICSFVTWTIIRHVYFHISRHFRNSCNGFIQPQKTSRRLSYESE